MIDLFPLLKRWFPIPSTLATLYENGIGPRTITKSLYAYYKTKANRSKRGLRNFLINGNTVLEFRENAEITNNGTLRIGLDSKNYPSPDKKPCALQMLKNSRLIINGFVTFNCGVTTRIAERATLEIGDNVAINTNSKVFCNERITIESDVLIGWEAQVLDSDGHFIEGTGLRTAPITIGKKVWVGNRVTILKGVNIGEGSVLAAGSIITKDVPAFSLVAGVPGRVIKTNIKWKRYS